MAAQAWPVVYGEDGRTEPFALDDAKLRDLAEARAVAITRPEVLVTEGGSVSVRAPSLAEVNDLCSGQRFADQPAAAVCSGMLIDEQTVLTAGHCLRGMFCDEMRLLFGYFNRPDGGLSAISSADVYRCKAVLATQHTNASEGDVLDYAWIQLDRPVRGGAPLPIRGSANPLATGERVTLVGFGGGLPLKIDRTGMVVDVRSATQDYFVTTVDSLDGNSGSAILDEDRRLVGIQGRGGTDYWPSDAGCNQVVSEPNDGSTASEQATYASRALAGLCKAVPEHALCCASSHSCDLRVSRGGCDVARPLGLRATPVRVAFAAGSMLAVAITLCRRSRWSALVRKSK